MRKFLVLGLLLLTVVAGYAREDQDDRVKVGDTMPAFTIVRDDGSKIASSDFKGKVILVISLPPGARLARKSWRRRKRACGRSIRIVRTLSFW